MAVKDERVVFPVPFARVEALRSRGVRGRTSPMNAMQQIERIDEDCAVFVDRAFIEARDIAPDEVCWNCGDGRGWTVSWSNYGDEQVQCPCKGRASRLNVYTRDDITRITRKGRR